MDHTVYTKQYAAPPYDRNEILRYAGVRGSVPELETLLQSCLDELTGRTVYKVCYRTVPVTVRGDILDLGFTQTGSESLRRNLLGCDQAVLFAATVGLETDRLIARYASVSPTKSLLFSAIGAERIESLCDLFNREVTEEMVLQGRKTRPRFSPGYGDLPLDLQRDIFAVLDCPRKIGLTLNESLVMSPSKSVTALIGVAAEQFTQDIRNEEA